MLKAITRRRKRQTERKSQMRPEKKNNRLNESADREGTFDHQLSGPPSHICQSVSPHEPGPRVSGLEHSVHSLFSCAHTHTQTAADECTLELMSLTVFVCVTKRWSCPSSVSKLALSLSLIRRVNNRPALPVFDMFTDKHTSLFLSPVYQTQGETIHVSWGLSCG